jgi:ketosteroid isomerase-like protein
MNLRNSLIAAAVVAGCFSPAWSQSDDVAAINASVQHMIASVNAKDIDGIMSYYVPDNTLFVFDSTAPRQYIGADAYRKDWQTFLSIFPKTVHMEMSDWKAEADGNLAFGHGIVHTVGAMQDGTKMDMTVRITDVFRKVNGKWLVIHEHVSWPVDMTTGKPDFDSKP